ncbi:hypothetical protein MMC18_005377 [Xylographa bjoerkii]|nr:hypothetical protein [Xylographa bjoerkii]
MYCVPRPPTPADAYCNMVLENDIQINGSRLQPDAVTEAQQRFNENLIAIGKKGPKWFEVGAEKYRLLRREGKTPLPKPTILDSGKSFSIPSREKGREIPCRIMMPEGEKDVTAVYMHIHGGGWVLQSEVDQDPLLKAVADGANVAVVSVGYRLAPEHSFPKGPEDCFDAAEWLVDHGKAHFGVPLKFMGGESAGGHLTLLTLFYLLESRPQFHMSGLVLNYGAYDLSFLPQARNFPKPLVLTPEIMVKYMDAFLPGRSPDERKDPSISPFYKDLSGLQLPPALFTCGTEDCLLEDTVMMALRWQMAGAETTTRLFPGAPHGFNLFSAEELPASNECRMVISEFLIGRLA